MATVHAHSNLKAIAIAKTARKIAPICFALLRRRWRGEIVVRASGVKANGGEVASMSRTKAYRGERDVVALCVCIGFDFL